MQNVACEAIWPKFIFDEKSLSLNAVKDAGGNDVAIICDNNRVKLRFIKMLNTSKPSDTIGNMFLWFNHVR